MTYFWSIVRRHVTLGFPANPQGLQIAFGTIRVLNQMTYQGLCYATDLEEKIKQWLSMFNVTILVESNRSKLKDK